MDAIDPMEIKETRTVASLGIFLDYYYQIARVSSKVSYEFTRVQISRFVKKKEAYAAKLKYMGTTDTSKASSLFCMLKKRKEITSQGWDDVL